MNEFHLVPYARLDWLSFFLKVIAGAGECSGGYSVQTASFHAWVFV